MKTKFGVLLLAVLLLLSCAAVRGIRRNRFSRTREMWDGHTNLNVILPTAPWNTMSGRPPEFSAFFIGLQLVESEEEPDESELLYRVALNWTERALPLARLGPSGTPVPTQAIAG